MEYEDRVVAFIDIMDFVDLLNKTKIKKKNNRLVDNRGFISQLYKTIERIRELMGIDDQLEWVAESRQVTHFSDSIVISFDLSDEPIEFKYMLGDLLHLTTELIKVGIMIRGGISYGSLIHTDKVLFGPAMVHAYMVESRAANSPRIILPKSLYDKDSEFCSLLRQEDKTGMELNDLLTRDEDDFFYLDYFDKCHNPALKIFVDDCEYIEHMRRLRKLIMEGIKTTEPGIYSKYGWMKTKWNRAIEKNRSVDIQGRFIGEKRQTLADYFMNEKIIKTAM